MKAAPRDKHAARVFDDVAGCYFNDENQVSTSLRA
jgi:hypothetical protein